MNKNGATDAEIRGRRVILAHAKESGFRKGRTGPYELGETMAKMAESAVEERLWATAAVIR